MRKSEAAIRRRNQAPLSSHFALLLLLLDTCAGFTSTLGHVRYSSLQTMSQTNSPSEFSDPLTAGDECGRNNGSTDETIRSVAAEQTSQAQAAVEFARLVGRLKVTPRTGWVRQGVPKWESVADHSWRVAALSLLLPSNDVDLNKCIAMGVLHDIAESLTGDICPGDNVSKGEKQRRESEALDALSSKLSQATVATGTEDSNRTTASEQLVALMHEYETRESNEAIGVKDLDLLDMIIQADEYEERFGLDLSDFFDGTPVTRFRTPAIQNVAQVIHDQRKLRMKAQEKVSVPKNGKSISKSDAAFVNEFCQASNNMSREEVEQIVKALRMWDEKANNE